MCIYTLAILLRIFYTCASGADDQPLLRAPLQLRPQVRAGRVGSEDVYDARAPGLPLKVARSLPLVRLESGRVRRLLVSEYARLGGLPWAVGLGDAEDAKTYAGNTWDWSLTDLTVRAAVEFMRPWAARRGPRRRPGGTSPRPQLGFAHDPAQPLAAPFAQRAPV